MRQSVSDRLRILITGRDGQVGWELSQSLASLGDITATSRAELDLASDDSIRAAVRNLQPDLIVNAAAYTAVDKAESEPELAQRINADAVATLAAEAKAIGAALIHYSTDYVFDGAKAEPHVEQDATHPLSVYGRTKLAGEQALASAGVPYLVLRTSWVYGPRGKNFLRTILKLATEKPELRIVDDQTGAPTSACDIAEVTRDITGRWLAKGQDTQERLMEHSGIYHLTAAGHTTWYGFAAEILRVHQGLSPTHAENLARLIPISSREYPTAAARPKNSQLDCSKLALSFQCRLPDWKISLADILRQVESNKPALSAATQFRG